MRQVALLCYFYALSALSSAHPACETTGTCHGFNLEFSNVESTEDCHEFCVVIEGCEWYTHDTATNMCVTFANCTEIDTHCTTCISGTVNCTNCFVDGECHGTLIYFMTTKTREYCLRECQAKPSCKWFSYQASDGSCLLLEDCQLDTDAKGIVSGERACNLVIDSTKIFYHHGPSTVWTDMPNTLNSTDVCSQPPEYPINVTAAASAVINGHIAICGGYYSATASCFSLNRNFNLWVEFPGLPDSRGHSASIMTDRGWWITGGFSGSSLLSSTVIFNTPTNAWITGPELPSINHVHCVVNINSGYSFLAGGNNGTAYLDAAWIYSWQDDSWVQVPDIPHVKHAAGCALYTYEQRGKHIIMAGGYSNPDYITVDAFDLTSMSWTQLPNLPYAAYGATMIQDGNDLFIINPTFNNIMQFVESLSTFVVINGLTTGVFGDYATVLPIDDFALYGC